MHGTQLTRTYTGVIGSDCIPLAWAGETLADEPNHTPLCQLVVAITHIAQLKYTLPPAYASLACVSQSQSSWLLFQVKIIHQLDAKFMDATAYARARECGKFSHALLLSGVEYTVGRVDCRMEVDLIGCGMEVVERIQNILLIYLTAVQIAVNALGIHEISHPQLSLHAASE